MGASAPCFVVVIASSPLHFGEVTRTHTHANTHANTHARAHSKPQSQTLALICLVPHVRCESRSRRVWGFLSHIKIWGQVKPMKSN